MFKTRSVFSAFFLLFLCSCSRQQFSTKDAAPQQTGTDQAGHYEVSVRDWLTYVVATSFTGKDQWIYLGDHIDKIVSKLPDLEVGGWSSYVIKASLISKMDVAWQKQTIFQDVYTHCTRSHNAVYIPQRAWDSIVKFKLLDVPVVGITYEQALEYLKYKETTATCSGKYRYECYLPTPEQFDSAQTAMDSLNKNGCHLFNYKDAVCTDCPNATVIRTHPVSSRIGKEPVYVTAYFPNDHGLYNMQGNVAEMTSVKGVAKGGSCAHHASEAYAGKIQEYTGPEIWLGFRVWYRVVPAK